MLNTLNFVDYRGNMSNEYNSIILGTTYVSLRAKYYATYTSNYFNPDHFNTLSKFLEKEQVSPSKYIDFVFGMLDFMKPPSPARLADPVLLEKFRQTVRS